MAVPLAPDGAAVAPLRGELRYGLELMRLVAQRDFHAPSRRADAPAVLLIPGFMAGDPSLMVMAAWLRRRGSRVARSGVLMNTGCAERAVEGIERRLTQLAAKEERRVVVLGQSRGGELARVVAVRNPDLVQTLVMLGSPVLNPLSVSPAVLSAVRSVAWLGDRGVPGMFSRECGDGPCCSVFREDLAAPLPASVRGISMYSRTDGIVAWQACVDPYAENVEVESSHTGMSVNAHVYRVLAQALDSEERAWTG